MICVHAGYPPPSRVHCVHAGYPPPSRVQIRRTMAPALQSSTEVRLPFGNLAKGLQLSVLDDTCSETPPPAVCIPMLCVLQVSSMQHS